jgi:hypothetical protein
MKRGAWRLYPVAWFLATSVFAGEPETAVAPPTPKSPGWQQAPKNVNDWADRCTDTTVNGWGFKDPKNFPKLLELFSDPAIYLEFAKRMQDPESYARVIGQMLDPNTARNYLEWSDPTIYTKWLQALAAPDFYTSAIQPLSDPALAMRWAALPIDQRSWSVGLNMLNPTMWLKWITSPLNPKVMAPLIKVADPTMPIRWLQTLANPDNFKAFNVGLTQNSSYSPSTTSLKRLLVKSSG